MRCLRNTSYDTSYNTSHFSCCLFGDGLIERNMTVIDMLITQLLHRHTHMDPCTVVRFD